MKKIKVNKDAGRLRELGVPSDKVEADTNQGVILFELPERRMPSGVPRTMKYGEEVDNPWSKDSVFLWCQHCERVYRRGECREIDGLQMCPYEGCDGDTVLDAWPWEKIRDFVPTYPVIPEEGKVYRMYPESGNSGES